MSAALVDSRFDFSGSRVDIGNPIAVRAAVATAMDRGSRAVTVVGDDATVSSIATAYFDVGRTRAEPMALRLLTAGSTITVGEHVGAPRATGRRLARAEGGAAAKTVRVATLAVVDSALPGVRLAFTFGLGSLSELLDEHTRLRKRDAIAGALRGGSMIDADLVVDWEHRASRFSYLMASSLPKSWAGVGMGRGASLRYGESVLDLVRGATRVGRVLERVMRSPAEPFERIHIDVNTDYVVDGVVVRVTKPRIVAVSPGPQVHILVG